MKRYTWGSQGAPFPMLNVVDWEATGGPRVVACVPQDMERADFRQPAAEAAVRLLETSAAQEESLAFIAAERDSLKARVEELERDAMESTAEALRTGERLAAAAAAEREACAKLVEGWALFPRNDEAQARIAAAIRARGGQ